MPESITPDEGQKLRLAHLKDVKRVVVKVGSAVLTGDVGLHAETMENLADELAFLRESGREVILVSSGAVAVGRRKLCIIQPTLSLKEKQAAAAVGQCGLMHYYDALFSKRNLYVSQVLLTHSDLAHRGRYLNIRNTMSTLFDWGVIPIINENDTVSAEELQFGDNDTLGALVTNLIDADIFICLTDVDSLYTGNPATDRQATPVHTVSTINDSVINMAGHSGSALGTGGMRSKILAAQMVAARGGYSFIGPGRQKGVIQSLFKGELVGTFFLPHEEKQKLHSRKHWIAFVLRPKGYLILDKGACRAVQRQGSSLLPSGVLEVRGEFAAGDPVHCLDKDGNEVAAGLVNYKKSEVEKICGRHSTEIPDILGYKGDDEVIHRDNLVKL
ncbi:MAG: glutamate 5-kinase [Thermodesulfobacteriota bacterium]